MMTAEGAHKTLRVLLLVLAVLGAVGGLVSILATGWLMKIFLPNLGGEASSFLLVALKNFGALAFLIAYLLYMTSRDPVRYVAVIDALSVTLFLLAAIDIYAIAVLNFGAYYPAGILWGRVTVRVVLGVVLIVLRPRNASASRSGASR